MTMDDIRAAGERWEDWDDAGEDLQTLEDMVRVMGRATEALLDRLEGRMLADAVELQVWANTLIRLGEVYKHKLNEEIGLRDLPQLVARSMFDELAAARLGNKIGACITSAD
jgi:hypothetical protein